MLNIPSNIYYSQARINHCREPGVVLASVIRVCLCAITFGVALS
jgi:hypothetical protein